MVEKALLRVGLVGEQHISVCRDIELIAIDGLHKGLQVDAIL